MSGDKFTVVRLPLHLKTLIINVIDRNNGESISSFVADCVIKGLKERGVEDV